MSKTLLAIFAICFNLLSFSQNWVNSAGGNFNDESYDVEVDASGNIYTTGYTTAASVFGPSINLTTNGYSDIYVSKSDANGNFLWVEVFGSTLADRGYDLALDNSGNIYVTGYFQGTANFGSFQLTASNNSQDIFILKLDNNGNVLWVKSEGGNEGDTGYGITVDSNGDVIVTGQFKGTAQIGLNNFSSTLDPNTGLPAYDIFISKYDNNGNDLWSIQGIAKYDDRGLAVKTDSNNDIYVTGQFSDTLNIAGSSHNNTIYNAGMVLKLDPTGNEIWFKRIGAIQTLVYDVEVDNQDNIYITGDFQGQMIIIGNPTNYFLNGNYTYRIFLIKMSPNGEVIWMQEDDSDSEVSSKAICLDNNQDPYITGTFKCVMDEYADSLGSGLFNSVGYNDVFITKYSNTGQQQWMRQYGGPLDDYCSGIAISQIDNPIISGGYTEYFNYPYSLATFSNFTGINQNFPSYSWTPGCSNNTYKYLNAVGAKDIVVGKPVNLNLNHYYYYEYGTCYNALNPPCIGATNCIDSAQFCATGYIKDFSHTAGNGFYYENYNANPFNPHHGPYYDFLWSNGDTTAGTTFNTTGYYFVNSERIDGCVSGTDSIYVTINPLPQLPYLSDDHGFNNQQYPSYNNMTLCYPDTVTTLFGDLDTTYQFTYTTPITSYSDSLPHQIFTAGNYSITVTDTNGCMKSDNFNLSYQYPISDTIVPYMLFNKDTICAGESVCYIIADSLTNPNGNYIAFCSPAIFSPSTNCLNSCFYPSSTGWHTITYSFILGYNNSCGLDTTHYLVKDSIYVTVLPNPQSPSYSLGGDPLLCPGDTINVWTDSLINGFSWNGPSILTINTAGDTIFANQQGTYTYSGTITDTITGCSKSFSKGFVVNVKPSPTITSNVPDNIICPNDSILLTCVQSGINYDWIGPQGNLIGSTQSIWVNVPGFYHCVLTDNDGCVLTSNTIELKEYNTPYILADPGTELCHTGAIELSVIYSGTPGLQWLPPINSSSSSVIVNQPGTYYVEVTQCGFTVTDSVVITNANLNITITPLTDTIICPGDTAILTTNSGMASYEWDPVQFFGQTLMTTDTGNYYVTVFDGATGCSAVSDTVHIGMYPGGTTPNVQGLTICSGDTATLYNLNSGLSTNWYSDSITLTPFASGDSITISNILTDTTIYIENYDSNCTSFRIAVNINVSPASFTPTITGVNSVCYGDTIILSTSTIPNGTYNWNGPNGFNSTQNPVIILNADSSYSGIYTLSISDNYCSSNDTNIIISILPPPIVNITTPDTIWKCPMDTVTISASGNYQSIIWNTGSTFDSTGAVIQGIYYAIVTDSNGCSSITDSVFVFNFTVAPPIVSDTTICYGDSVLLSSQSNQVLNWYDSSLVIISIDSTYQTPALYNTTYYAVTYTDSNGCESIADFITVNVTPANGTPNIYGDTILCEGEALNLYTDNITGATYQWSYNSGTISTNISYTNPSVTLIDSGYYYLTVNGVPCINTNNSVYVTVNLTPAAPTILGDTAYCSNDTLLLYTNSNLDSLIWIDPNFNYSQTDSLEIIPITSGYYSLLGIDSNGCISNIDTALITSLPAPTMPNIYVNNNYCAGDTITLYTDSSYNITYAWTGPNSYANNDESDTLYNTSTNNSGTYQLFITDTNGCSSGNQVNINVFDYPQIDLGPDTLICNDSLPYLLELDTIYSYYLWQDGSNNNYFNVIDSGWYFVTVQFGGGCTTTDSVYIETEDCNHVTPSNIFSPNGDGINDFFEIDNIEYFPNSKLEVFDRWGKLIYESDNYQNDWDGGGYHSSTYYYIFYPNDKTGKLSIYKGYVTLTR